MTKKQRGEGLGQGEASLETKRRYLKLRQEPDHTDRKEKKEEKSGASARRKDPNLSLEGEEREDPKINKGLKT